MDQGVGWSTAIGLKSELGFCAKELMGTQTLDRHIDSNPDIAGGKPRIAGHRITVQNIAIWHERMGKTPDEIAAEYDLTLADVHAALAYYFDHREEIEKSIAEGEDLVESLRARTPSKLLSRLQTQMRHESED